ncbi:hypothetical protein [Streptococcus oralis]|uniref:hypothetical protein n=1 Tax=Streptococcus oralis TaxID=1303 RepID=UPI001CBA8D99|nr:hypothetical protein [Streptococcus oralis]MBZ2097284.1 hypothetical protein [Streptococcus oralis]MBZ2102797.1 hypothetical protein [Streptococcus oralis]
MRKRKSIIIILFLIMSFVTIFFLNIARKKDYVGEPNRDYIIEDIKAFDDNKFVFASNKRNVEYGISFRYSQNYIVDFSNYYLLVDSDATSPKVGKEEYFKIKIYDLHNPSNLASKEVNLYDLMGKENTYRVAQYYDPFTRNGKDYLPIWMSSYEKGKAEKNKYVIFSLDTGKIEKEMSEKEIKQLLDQKETKVYSKETLYESMDWGRGGIGEQIRNELLKYGIEKVTGYLVQSFDKDDSVDVSGTNFSKLYPEISKNMKEMNKIYFRPEQYNEEEWFNDLIHWFAPEGQEVMELYATDETTGEKTQIRSFNDFKQWVETHPQKEE